MDMREALSIVIIGTNENQVIKSLESIYSANIKKYVKVYIMNVFDELVIKNINRQYEKKSNIKLIFRKIRYKNEYVPDHLKNFISIAKIRVPYLVKRKLEPYRKIKLNILRNGYVQSVKHIKGKYVMYLPEGTELYSNFWDKTMTYLMENKDICNYLSVIKYENLDNIEMLNNIYLKDRSVFEEEKGIFEMLSLKGLVDVLPIFKRKYCREIGTKTVSIDYSSNKFFLDYGISLRMLYSKSVIQYEPIAKIAADDEYIGRKFDFDNAVLRIAFLKGYIFFGEKGKWNAIGKLRGQYIEAFNAYKELLSQIAEYYKDINENELSERFKHLSNSL